VTVTTAGPGPVAAQSAGSSDIAAYAALVADSLPNRDAAELRPEIGLDLPAAPTDRITFRLDGSVEGLTARRQGRGVGGAALRLREAWGEVRWRAVDLRAGYGRLVWGRLDELSPSDVINPLDLAAFLIEGRSAARLPVLFARTRVSAGERVSAELVLVPKFRRGVFDLLEESSSPFNLVGDVVTPAAAVGALAVLQREPDVSTRNLSGGARLQVTAGRVDLSASVFRGFESFGPIVFEPALDASSGVAGRLVELHPRFTMIAGDLETVTGPWAWRAEVAVRPDRQFAAVGRPGLASGRSVDAGVGFDRRAGAFRVFGSALVHTDSSDDPLVSRTDTSLIGSVERTFGRDRYLVRGFGVVNPADRSGFLRGLASWKVRDHIVLDGSAAAFLGTSDDTIGRFAERDFLLARIRYDF
jgi:hypothetical protein